MSVKCESYRKYDDTLNISKCRDGYWLYDITRGMNLSMRAISAEDALFEALKYYQKRLLKIEGEYKTLSSKVESFVSQFMPEEEYPGPDW